MTNFFLCVWIIFCFCGLSASDGVGRVGRTLGDEELEQVRGGMDIDNDFEDRAAVKVRDCDDDERTPEYLPAHESRDVSPMTVKSCSLSQKIKEFKSQYFQKAGKKFCVDVATAELSDGDSRCGKIIFLQSEKASQRTQDRQESDFSVFGKAQRRMRPSAEAAPVVDWPWREGLVLRGAKLSDAAVHVSVRSERDEKMCDKIRGLGAELSAIHHAFDEHLADGELDEGDFVLSKKKLEENQVHTRLKVIGTLLARPDIIAYFNMVYEHNSDIKGPRAFQKIQEDYDHLVGEYNTVMGADVL